MIKALPILFLLDFSGSMDQVFEGKIKSEMLKTNIQGIIETTPPEKKIEAFIYGSNPAKKCNDFIVLQESPANVKKTLLNLKPGPFGKTPLSEGLKKITARAIETQATHIITLTDGGDTCGQDPCKTLIESNKQLEKVHKKLNLILIAFDLKQEKGKFQCFKDLKLSNMKINLLEAENESAIYDALTQVHNESLGVDVGIDPNAQEGQLHQIQNSQKNQKPGSNEDGATDSNDAGNLRSGAKGRASATRTANKEVPEQKPIIEITGAPALAEFSITGEKLNRSWHGSFAMEVDPGKYTVKFLDEFGLALDVILQNGDVKKIPWGQLMKNATSQLMLKKVTLGVLLKPQEKTRQVHGDIKEVSVDANILDDSDRSANLPFGEWTLDITNPIWLKDKLPTIKISVPRGQTSQTAIEEAYREKVKWVQNPYPTQMSVLEIIYEDKRTERFLLTPGQRMIPIPKKAMAKFLLSNEK